MNYIEEDILVDYDELSPEQIDGVIDDNIVISETTNSIDDDNNNQQNTSSLHASGVSLELGDIIELISPTNTSLHEQTFYIKYIDSLQIKLINVASLSHHQLNLLNNQLSDESIIQINILNRSEVRGYARQQNLLPTTWINIHFGGDIPTIITGEISKLDEDMIEIITYPELNTIYIDFQYKGIPEHIPIVKIIIREKPLTIKNNISLESLKENNGIESDDDNSIGSEDSNVDFSEDLIIEPSIRDSLQELYTDANDIIFRQLDEPMYNLVEVPAHEQRFSIDEQVNDMMDELLSTIPNINRTKSVLDNIHNLIIRFKELRQTFSLFDTNNNICDINQSGPFSKPLVECISKLNMNMKWIIPVVSNQQKIYDADTSYESFDILHETIKSNLTEIKTTQSNYYDSNDNTSIGYTQMKNQVNQLAEHYTQPLNQDNCIASTNVLTGIDSIVNNLNDFYSSIYSKSGVTKRKYVINRYNLDSDSIIPGPSDKICVNSLIMLPQQFIKFSSISLPTTSLLSRVNLHQNYMLLHKLFNKHTDIIPHIINDLSTELDHKQIDTDTKNGLFNGIHEFILDKDSYYSENNKFHQFLETIIPKTKTILKLFRKYIRNKFSFIDVVQQFEPFMIYTSDISYKQYMEIRFFIKESINEYKQNENTKKKDFLLFKNSKYNVDKLPNMIRRILTEKKEFTDLFQHTYTFLNKDKHNYELSSQEILLRMLQTDNCLLYTDLITSLLASLIVPNSIIDVITNPNIDDITELEQIKPNDCTKRVLAKIYSSVSDLQKDNNKDEIWIDPTLDDTPYDILKKYKDEQKHMMPDIFIEFLVENLIQKHDCPANYATELAKIIIAKKKMVVDGNYALLEIKPPLKNPDNIDNLNNNERESLMNEYNLHTKIQYYRRLKNNWVKDDDINDESFLDTSTIFCNIDNKCMKNLNNNICESNTDIVHRIKQKNIKNMETEFDRRIAVSIGDIEKSLETQISYHLKMISKNEILKDINLHRSNNLAFEIGKRANVNEIIISPHVKIRDLILGQSDFSKKQRDICRFVSMTCREPTNTNIDESAYMYYCKDTNVKLFPMSLYQLANAFVTNGDYQYTLNKICADSNIVAISDDGDSIIDKHCGLVIKKRDFNTEEEFDEQGFPIKSHDILETDLGSTVANSNLNNINTSINHPIFDSEINETIYNITNAICSNIDIPILGIYEQLLRISNELITTEILSENSYKRKSDIQLKKNAKPLGPYDKYRNETIILIVSCVLIITIQTAVPSFKTNRTYPGCIRSFSGYPMDGIEDITCIKYIACVLNKIKSSIVPWNSIQTRKVDKLTEMIKSILDKQIMKRADINLLYDTKREFNLLNPTLITPDEHSITKWVHFLPPVIPYSVEKTLQPVSVGFHKEVIGLLKNSNQKHEIIHMLSGKIIKYGYGIIEAINDIVKNKDLLLKTSNNIPFLENACCNETSKQTTPISYFIENDPKIKINIQSSIHMTKILNNIHSISRSPFLFHPGITRQRVINVANGYSEETIYNTIIHYCNFDKNLPIPDSLQSICNNKPDLYNHKLSILEKIELLKKSGKRYNIESVNHLMNIINKNNIVDTKYNPSYNPISAFTDIIEHLDKTNSDIISEPLRRLLTSVIAQYKPNVMHDNTTQELDDLNDYLIISNQQLYKQIMSFFNVNGKTLSNQEYQKLHKFLSTISSWKNDQTTNGTYDTSFYSVVQYIKNAILMISKIYPIILFNDSDLFKNIPKHWGLSQFHIGDIEHVINKYYANIEGFKGDVVLNKLFNEVISQLTDLNLFVQNIPIQSDIIKQVINEDNEEINVRFFSIFNKSTIYLLLTHCLYNVLYQYIRLSDDTELLHDDINILKQNRRTNIQTSKNASNYLHAISSETNDELNIIDNELQEVQIQMGNTNTLKERVCSLLISFLDIEQKNKESIDYTYSDIMSKVNRAKEREKKEIVDYFGAIENKQERNVERMLKEFRIGRWNVGQQKGLVSYDKNTYDRERTHLFNQTTNDLTLGEHNIVSEMRREIFDIEHDEELEQENDEQDELRIDGLGENYMDGEFYEEDQSDNF